jgi:hypothetical protein
MTKDISNEEVLEELVRFYDRYGKSPTIVGWDENSDAPFSSDLIKYRFGRWNVALKQAGLSLNASNDGKEVPCLECGKMIYRTASRLARNGKRQFCSTACSNKHRAVKQAKRECLVCGKVFSGNRKYCSRECRSTAMRLSPDITLEEYGSGYTTWEFHGKIRSTARYYLVSSGRSMVCQVCDYDKHVECCHIIPIAEFPKTATLGEVNKLSNLVWLCPNHHWELDHRLLDVSQIKDW